MLKNYFKIAWRNLFRNKVYSAINIAGLAIGMATALLIGIWIADELNVNRNFKHYDRIVSFVQNSSQQGQTHSFPQMPIPLAEALRTQYAADFSKLALISWEGGCILATGETKTGTEGRFVQPDLLDILPVELIRGGGGANGTAAGTKALEGPGKILIDRSLATSLFGRTDPIGRIVKKDNQYFLRVTGVYEDLPSGVFGQTHFLTSLEEFFTENPGWRTAMDSWTNNGLELYAQLQPHADPVKVSAKIKGLLGGHGRSDHPELLLHPMSKWHLYNNFVDGKNVGGAIQFVKMFGLIGLFVLLLACINFMNLSTARSGRRAREVGIRKAMGSMRLQLIGQFLGESFLITGVAVLVSLGLALLAMPWFNQVADKQMSIPWTKPLFWVLIAGFAFITGLIAGSYPAFYLSSFNPIKVLKGKFKAGRLASLPRKALVVLQFSVSTALVVGTIVIYKEIQFVRNRPMGYDRKGLFTVYRGTPELIHNYTAIYNALVSTGAVEEAALSSDPTTRLTDVASGFSWAGKDPNTDPSFGLVYIGQNFGKAVGWQFLEGRDFSKDLLSDSMSLVLNASAVKLMGLKHPVGTILRADNRDFHVIGVINDMVMESPFQPVTPTIFSMVNPPDQLAWATIKLNPAMSIEKATALIAPVFLTYNPGSPFGLHLNDEEYAKNFVLESRIGALTTVFAFFAIFISCLGLFGLASFTAEQRTREIGIRKVLGASILNLWGLLSKEFLLLVCLSFLVAMPLAYYVMHGWLQQYDYRTPISVWVFVGTMGIALLITMLTVSLQSIRASLANPVSSLRTE
jgi:putative ABC transport system permease protein